MLNPYQQHFHGRRKGRTLRTHKSHLMQTLLPKMKVDLAHMNLQEPIWLEIGFGGGEHLAAMALQNPKIQFLGCEVFENGIASLLDHIDKNNLKNIVIYPEDTRPFLKTLPENYIEKVFILFPDPWPKKKHLKRRLVNKAFLEDLLRILKSQSILRFASDHEDYIKDVQSLIQESQAFQEIIIHEERPEDWPLTIYNQKAILKGTPSRYLEAKCL